MKRLTASVRRMVGLWTLMAAPCRNRLVMSSNRQKSSSKKGADILRLWVASVDFIEDVRMSEVILDRFSEAYRKLRNTFRWMLGNLGTFDPASEGVAGKRSAWYRCLDSDTRRRSRRPMPRVLQGVCVP